MEAEEKTKKQNSIRDPIEYKTVNDNLHGSSFSRSIPLNVVK